jgi:hypothetical protein
MNRNLTTLAALSASVLTVGISLASCASAQQSQSPAESVGQSAGCALEIDNEGSDDQVVIMVDRSASRGDSAAGFDRSTVSDIFTQLASTGPLVSIATYGGTDAEIESSGCFERGHFRPDFNSAARRADAVPALVQAAVAEYERLGGFELSDPTVAYRAGAEKLRGATAAQSMIIVTDGVPTAGCAALSERIDPTDLGQIDSLVADCTARGLLPNLAGVTVFVAGVGRSAEPLSNEAVTFLRNLNQALCEASGATCQVILDSPTL